MKICGKCRLSLPLESFYRHHKRSDGRQSDCKNCQLNCTPKILTCQNCKTDFSIKHRNVKKRKFIRCEACKLKQFSIRLSEQNRNRTKHANDLRHTKGYRHTRDHSVKHGYSLSHRVIMAKHIGRPLERTEIVHHIDGNKINNELSNLWLTDNSGHAKAHASIELLAMKMVRDGKIFFCRETGEYELNENQSCDTQDSTGV